MRTIWKFSIKGARSVTQRTPIVFQDQVIVTMNHGLGGNFKGTISALCKETGLVNWSFDHQHFFSQPIVDNNGAIFVTSFDGSAHKLGIDGQLLWSSKVAETNLWSGVLHAGKFLFSEIAGGSRFTWALDAETGEVVWRFEDGGHGYGVISSRATSAIVSSVSRDASDEHFYLHCIDVETGQQNWKSLFRDRLFRPAICNSLVVVGTRGGFAAFKEADGSLVAEGSLCRDTNFDHSVVVQDEKAFLASNDGHIVALAVHLQKSLFLREKASVSVQWETQFGGAIDSLSLGLNALISQDASGHLSLIDPRYGSKMQSKKVASYKDGRGVAVISDDDLIMAVGRYCSRIKL